MLMLLGTGSRISGIRSLFDAFSVFKKDGNIASGVTALKSAFQGFDKDAAGFEKLGASLIGLGDSSKQAIVSMLGLTEEQAYAALVAAGYTEAQAAAIAPTVAAGTAAGGAAGGFTALGTSIAAAAKGLATFLLTNPIGWAILATTAVVGVATAVKKYNEYQAELRQKAIEVGNAAQDEARNISQLYTAYQSTYSLYQENIASKEELESATDSLLDALGVERGAIQGLVGDYEALNGVLLRTTSQKLSQDISEMHSGLIAQEKEIGVQLETYQGGQSFKSAGANYRVNGALGDYLNKKLGTNTIARVLWGDAYSTDQFENAKIVYEQYQQFKNEIFSGIESGLITQADVDNNKSWQKILSTFSEYETMFQEHAEKVKSINETTALLGYNNYITDHGLPETQQEFDALTKSILQSGYASERFVGTEKDVMSGLSNMFSQIPQLKDFYSKWLGDNTVQEIKDNFSNLFPKPDASNTTELREWQNEISAFDKWINGLSEEDRNIVCNIALKSDTAKYSLYDWEKALDDAKEHAETAAQKISNSVQSAINNTSGILTSIGAANTVIGQQTTGKSISIDDYNSADLKDYADALEYVNGAYQLNIDKVREISKAKADEQIAINKAEKALAQDNYLANAAKIEQLRNQIVGYTDAQSHLKENAQSQIDSLLAQNEALSDSITQYDLLTASLQEATGAYQNWLNAQNGPESGDLFETTSGMVQQIIDTNTEGNEDYLKYGTNQYKANVEFLVPDSIDHEDEEAVSNYIQSITKYFKKDADGKLTDDLNVDQFLSDAVKKGLMNADNGEYKIAGQKTMKDFAEGLNLSLPFVQSVFGMLEEYDFHFNWADEGVKTLRDLAVKANESAEALRQIDGIDGAKINLDISDCETAEEATNRLQSTIEYLDGQKAHLSVEGQEQVNDVIQYCVRLQQEINRPMIMNVDASKVEGDLGEAIATVQELQTAINELEVQKSIGADTTEAQSEVDGLVEKVNGLSPEVKVSLGLDPEKTLTQEDITSAIAAIDTEAEIKVILGLEESAELTSYMAEDHTVDGLVKFGKNSEEPDAYESADHNVSSNVTYSLVEGRGLPYNPPNLTRTVTYYETTVKTKVNGTAHASGTAKAGGDWRDKIGGNTLVGELGVEIVVNPRTGRWYTVGDNGAEFVNIPKGAIIFNHKQSESLLKYGYVAGRAHSLVNGSAKGKQSGSAMVTGGGKWTPTYNLETDRKKIKELYPNYTDSQADEVIAVWYQADASSNSSSTTQSSSSSSSSTGDKEPEKVDWIEILLDRAERAVNKLSKVAESAFKKLSTRLGASRDEISKVTKEIELQHLAYDRYMQEAESVGLDADLAQMVRNGLIHIDEYDEATQKLITKYKEFYEKAIDCSEAVDDLHGSLAELYRDNFDNVKTDYDNQLGLLEHQINTYQSGIDMIQQKGYLAGTAYYESLADLQQQNIVILQNELNDLTAQFKNAMASGEIEEYSEAWYGFQNDINSVKEAIADANKEMITLTDNINSAQWDAFDYASGKISQITDEADFLIDLMGDYDTHNDNGTLTDKGMATMGLHGMNYNVYMAQANRYGEEVKRLNKLLKDDPYNTNYISRREEVLQLQRESIKAAQEQKTAITELVKDGIEKELDSLKKLIDKYKDSLDAAKDLNDYQERISDQAKEVATLRKQLTAYSGDESEEGRARLQKIQTELEKAEKDLAKTEYDQYISDQKEMLDELYDSYEETLNKRVDDIDRVLEEQTESINANAYEISDTINDFAESMGYTVTDNMETIWNKNTIAASFDGVMAKYDKDYSTQLTSINTTLGFIDNWVRLATNNTEKTYDAIVDTDNMMIDPHAYETLHAEGVKKYKGGGLIDYTGIARVDGSASRPEMVLDSADTRNFISLRDSLRSMASRPLSMSGIGIAGNIPMGGIYDISDRLSAVGGMTYNTGYTFGDIEINIPINHVENYNDFMRQLQKDRQFEEMVQDMTVNRVMGRSSLAKNRHQW